MTDDYTFITQSSNAAEEIFLAKSTMQDTAANSNTALKLPSISAPN
jgi:hypothetical protein